VRGDGLSDERSLDHLAAARQAMSVNTAVAVKYVQGFRDAWGDTAAGAQPASGRPPACFPREKGHANPDPGGGQFSRPATGCHGRVSRAG
jgi:hypothetical protein